MPVINGRYFMNPAYGRHIDQGLSSIETALVPIVEYLESGSIESVLKSLGQNNSSIEPPEGPPSNNGSIERSFEFTSEQARNHSAKNREFKGDATYYNLPGSKTASGYPFDPNKMAAAMTSEKVPLNQTVSVTYTYKDAQGNSVTKTIPVVVNDRGPFARDAHGKALHPLRPDPKGIIDLTPAAFRQLAGSLKPGRISVTVTVPDD